MILNCRNFDCKFNNKGKCRLEIINLQDDGSSIINKIICIEAEEKNENLADLPIHVTKTIDSETTWGIPKEDLPEQEPKDYFAPKDEQVPG